MRRENLAQKSSERLHFFVSILLNMASIAPALTWPLFVPYMATYKLTVPTVDMQSYAETLFILQVLTSCAMDFPVAYLVRKINGKLLVVMGYLLLLGSTLGA